MYGLEIIFFAVALIALYCMDTSKNHVSLCPFANFGFKFCPGCGLGHSLNYLMHFQALKSWRAHPLGIFTFFVIIYRLCTLIIKTITT
ncbi:DUF2752 domain-containing protein [Pedobacter sp. SD-b]|uniref:DUF2752 domain-containing protein n=1 Tax=Pedobacter segetis TaxID=2793069 RepID=A0ABS1BH63_9SPHI|nr:DUF2752 domain-containing protein [Pedobacter segetis]